VRDLAKAKESPSFRFCALYDKVYRPNVLRFPHDCCKVNGGAAGVDGQTFEDIEVYDAERWLDELTQELKDRTYRPLPVRKSGFRSRTVRNSSRCTYRLSATG
jgi:RNA-directed DNA polymerase